jgi:autotransporter-associated beta strand protein
MKPKSLLFGLLAISSLNGIAYAQTAKTWTGTTADMALGTNWTPAGLPSATVQDSMIFNGSSTFNSLTFNGGTFSGNPGLGGLSITAAQTSALSINNTGTAGSVFRLGANASVTIASGAGAVTFGGANNTYFINLNNTTNTTNTFTNDSSNLATISSNVTVNATTGSGGQPTFTGTGNWLVAGTISNASTRGVIKNGTGNLTLSNTANAFASALTINGGNVILGNNEVLTNAQSVNVNALGTLNLNGFNETINGITGAGIIQNEGSGTSTLTVGAGNGSSNFSGTIRNNSGAGAGIVALTKSGTGTLTLSGTNSHTGLTTISAGTLNLASPLPADATALSGGTIAGESTVNGLLTLNSGSGILVNPVSSGALNAANGLTLTGTVNIGFSQAPSSTSPFTVITYSGTLTGGAANLSLIGGTTNYRNPVFDDTTPGIITLAVGSESRTWNGGAAWDINNSTNWLEGDNKFFQLDSVTFTDTGAGSIALTGTLAPSSITVNSTTDYTFTAATAGDLIAGSTGITKSGTGTLTLGGANTFTGPITINAGTLRPTSTSALGANGNTITVATGAVLDHNGAWGVNRDYNAIIAGNGTGAGALINNGLGQNAGFRSLTLTADATIGGTGRFDIRPITPGNGVIHLDGFTLTKSGTNIFALVDSVFTSDGNIEVSQGELRYTRNSTTGTTGSVSLASGSILTFENNTTGNFGWDLEIDNATIQSLGTAYTLNSAAALTNTATFNLAVNLNLAGNITGTGTISKTGTAALILTGDATHTGGTTVTTGTLQIGASGTSGSITGNITNDATVTFDRSDAFTHSGSISGLGAVIKQGAGALTLSASNTYAGNTTINAGSLQLGTADNRLPTTTNLILANNATANLDLNGLNQETRTLSGGGAIGGNITNTGASPSTLTIRPTTTDNATFSGTLSGDTRLAVLGDKLAPSFVAPRQRLANINNTFTGGVLVDGATLMARQDGSLGTIPVAFEADSITLQNNGTLLNEADGNALSIHQNRGITLGTGGGALVAGFNQPLTVNSVISGAAGNAITILGNNGTVFFTADNTYLGDTILGPVTGSGTARLTIGNGGTSGSLGAGNVINDGQLTFNRSDSYTYSGSISGSGTLIKQGSGTVSLTGPSTYTGATTISAGTLAINNTHGTSSITIAPTGTLAGTGTISGLTTVNGTVSPGNTVGQLTTTDRIELTAASSYLWQISNWNGSTPGTDWDHIQSAEIFISAPLENQMILRVTGSPSGFSESNKSFEIARSTFAFFPTDIDNITIDDSNAPGNGTWSLSLADSNSALVLNYTAGTADPFQSWIDSFTSITDPLKKTPEADADDDGLANMVEYVLDTDPSNGTSENLPTAQLSPSGENLIFTFTRLKEAGTAGFVSNVEYSETLQNGSWQTATGPMTDIIDNGLTETVTVTIPVPEGADSVFARLTVTAP